MADRSLHASINDPVLRKPVVKVASTDDGSANLLGKSTRKKSKLPWTVKTYSNWLKQNLDDPDTLFDVDKVSKPNRDAYWLRAELSKTLHRKLINAVDTGMHIRNPTLFKAWERELIAVHNTDPLTYLEERKWKGDNTILPGEHIHHKRGLKRFVRGTKGFMPGMVEELHKILDDLDSALGNAKGNAEQLGERAHLKYAHKFQGKAIDFKGKTPLTRGLEISKKKLIDQDPLDRALYLDASRRIIGAEYATDILQREGLIPTNKVITPEDLYSGNMTQEMKEVFKRPEHKKYFKAINQSTDSFNFTRDFKHFVKPGLLTAGALGLSSFFNETSAEELGKMLDPSTDKKKNIQGVLRGAKEQLPTDAAIAGLSIAGGKAVPGVMAGIGKVVSPLFPAAALNVSRSLVKGASKKYPEEHALNLDKETNSSLGSGGYMSSMFGGGSGMEHLAASSLRNLLKTYKKN